MTKKLTIYISLLVAFVLIFSTGIYFHQSEKTITKEINELGKLLTEYNKKSINEFLSQTQKITYLIYNDEKILEFLKRNSKEVKNQIEELFLQYCNELQVIQAIRVVDKNGKIKVFIRECENLSGDKNYKDIDISEKDFFIRASLLNNRKIIFSNFERGKLPETVNFCPAMIRTVIPYFENGEKIGYLIINFWGQKIGEMVSYMESDKGYSFIVELNDRDKNRDGVFLFHPNKYYEFANQFDTEYLLDNVYESDLVKRIRENEKGVIKLKKKKDFLAFSTIYPYEDRSQIWKVCTLLKGSYFFKNIDNLRVNFIIITVFSIILSALTAIYLSKKLMSPLYEINSAAKRYAQGDLNYRINKEFDEELRYIADTINDMAESLQKYIKKLDENHKKIEILNIFSSIGFLSSGISHELNTPLNSIIIICKILEKDIKNDSKLEDIKTIKEQAIRCVDIINSLKALSPHNSLALKKEKIYLSKIVEDIVKFMEIGKKISFHLNLNKNVYIYGDKRLLQLAISNILMNALDAIYPEGDITIVLFEEENNVVLQIEDSGEGIDESELNNIFTPFFTTKSSSNMGIGLSLVYKIVKEHSGEIKVSSKKGVGTKFILRFESYAEGSIA